MECITCDVEYFLLKFTDMTTIRNSLLIHIMLEVVAGGLYGHYF